MHWNCVGIAFVVSHRFFLIKPERLYVATLSIKYKLNTGTGLIVCIILNNDLMVE